MLLGKCTGISFMDRLLIRKQAIIEIVNDEIKNDHVLN